MANNQLEIFLMSNVLLEYLGLFRMTLHFEWELEFMEFHNTLQLGSTLKMCRPLAVTQILRNKQFYSEF